VANHPNQWYQASVKYHALKSGVLLPGTGAGGGGGGTGTGIGTEEQGVGVVEGQREGVGEGLSVQQNDNNGEPPTD
jgi:hypothetical protein